MITRNQPYSTAYDLYGNPSKLVEFRLFSLNQCSQKCKGCFYDKVNNTYNDFESMHKLAYSMQRHGYKLETCYLLPTDIFDNPANYQLFDNDYLSDTLSMFSYVGVAATLEGAIDYTVLNNICSKGAGIELQVNLVVQRLRDINYRLMLEHKIKNLKAFYGDHIVINLAINTGFKLSKYELGAIKRWITQLSEDQIVELNFTFLYNDDISESKKKHMMAVSVDTVNEFKRTYQQDASYKTEFNNRTFLNKPSFAFIGSPNRVYVNPIVPFDEYVFVQDDKYTLLEPSFEGFLEAYGEITKMNDPILEKCETCHNLQFCSGKHYFSIAREFELGCILDKQVEN